ncbi:MAG TPA: ArsR family transcriptional regulator [Longimicrobium sp.]|nr:ArsR family transcriptional regulator [Longimicrobium sp.]
MRTDETREARDTRGEILRLLCVSAATISDLAPRLGISRNAVRAHLDRLEAEGLVRYQVVRRGVGKPAHEYRLTDTGEAEISRAYLPLLVQLLALLEHETTPAELERLLRAAGRGLAAGGPPPRGALRERVEAASAFLKTLGGIGGVEKDGEGWRITAVCCPVGTLVPRQPLICKAVEALLAELTAAPVLEACDRGPHPKCHFHVRRGPEGGSAPRSAHAAR